AIGIGTYWFARSVDEMTLHPRPASPGTTIVVETDHPPVELSTTGRTRQLSFYWVQPRRSPLYFRHDGGARRGGSAHRFFRSSRRASPMAASQTSLASTVPCWLGRTPSDSVIPGVRRDIHTHGPAKKDRARPTSRLERHGGRGGATRGQRGEG